MASYFKNVLFSELGVTEETLLTTVSNGKTTVIGLSFTNLTGSVVLVDVKLQDTIAITEAYFMKNIVIPPNTSLRAVNGGEKLILGPSTAIKVKANFPDSIDIVMSYVEIV
jgi:hypothetical protein